MRAYAKVTFRAIGVEFGFWIEGLAAEDDHVHVFLEFPPKCVIAWVVGILKSIPPSRTSRKFLYLRRKLRSEELSEDGHAVPALADRLTADLLSRYILCHDEVQATNEQDIS